VFEHGERFRFESTSDAVDGTLRYDEHRLGSIRTGGHVEGVIVYTTDVTDRRADERRLRTQASVLATATSVVIGSERFFITVRKDITELRRLAAGVLRISQHEKEQPARKLHEGLGQQLSGISFLASSLRAGTRPRRSSSRSGCPTRSARRGGWRRARPSSRRITAVSTRRCTNSAPSASGWRRCAA